MTMQQEKLFNGIKSLLDDIGDIVPFFQNDIERMIEDGYTTKDSF